MVEAVARACQVIASFRYEGEVLRLKDLVDRTGLSFSTTFRILFTLQQGGLIERVGNKEYRSNVKTLRVSRYRLGYAHQGAEPGFVQEWSDSVVRAAAKERIELLVLDHGHDSQTPLRNAERLIREQVDLVIDYLGDAHVAAINASKFAEANIPVIAVGAPRPGAIYYGPDNYVAGLMGGRYLGRWAKQNWHGKADELLLLDIDISGPLQALRMKGVEVGLKQAVPELNGIEVVRLNCNARFLLTMELIRDHLCRSRARRILVGAAFDPSALGALRALEEAGRSEDIAVVSLGGCVEGRMELRRPGTRLIGDVAFFVDKYGENVIRLAMDVLEKKPIPSASFAKHKVLTPENVDHYYPNDSLLSPTTAENPLLRCRPITG